MTPFTDAQCAALEIVCLCGMYDPLHPLPLWCADTEAEAEVCEVQEN
mgnify:FL=1